MPELPEVETTRRGIEPHVVGSIIEAIHVRQTKLRNVVPTRSLQRALIGTAIERVGRRGKYLLLSSANGHLLIHLGMSGSLRLLPKGTPAQKHDHVDIVFDNERLLRFTDPRKFGVVDWFVGEPNEHVLLKHLGPEPLTDRFTGQLLYARSRKRSVAVKQFIMDSRIVVGVGNIYANEALFKSGIHPLRQAGRISLVRYEKLASMIKSTLDEAIKVGGTTLRDFTGSDGQPGYFKQSLLVYGRAAQPCKKCQHRLSEIRLNGRSSVYCSHCQK
jgi:formamidopyrimidine-DNA glycosylase